MCGDCDFETVRGTKRPDPDSVNPLWIGYIVPVFTFCPISYASL